MRGRISGETRRRTGAWYGALVALVSISGLGDKRLTEPRERDVRFLMPTRVCRSGPRSARPAILVPLMLTEKGERAKVQNELTCRTRGTQPHEKWIREGLLASNCQRKLWTKNTMPHRPFACGLPGRPGTLGSAEFWYYHWTVVWHGASSLH